MEDISAEPLKKEIRCWVWKYLQYIYITGSYALGLGSTDPLVKEMLCNIRAEREIQREITQEIDDEEEVDKSKAIIPQLNSTLGSGIGEIFGEDNILVQLAQDVSEELASNLDLNLDSEEIQNPFDVITKLFG